MFRGRQLKGRNALQKQDRPTSTTEMEESGGAAGNGPADKITHDLGKVYMHTHLEENATRRELNYRMHLSPEERDKPSITSNQREGGVGGRNMQTMGRRFISSHVPKSKKKKKEVKPEQKSN